MYDQDGFVHTNMDMRLDGGGFDGNIRRRDYGLRNVQ